MRNRRRGGGDADSAPPVHRSRRQFLSAIPASIVGLPIVGTGFGRTDESGSSTPLAARQVSDQPDGGFDPAVHGFGFQNWSTAVPTYPEHGHDDVTEEQVRRALFNRWSGPVRRSLSLDVGRLPSSLLDIVATHLYVAVNQRSATNGHCYGMVFAAQEYFESPESIPFGRASASEFTHPDEPVDDPDVSPVAREVDLFQNTQFLDFYAWIGRRAIFRPDWIDYPTQLDHVRAVIDAFGTAGVTLVNTTTRMSHQVLLYGYRTTPTGTSFLVYEPNRAASQYAAGRTPPTLDVDTRGSSPVVQPYSSLAYDAFVYNRYDRVIAARGSAEPLDVFDRSGDQLREALFGAALFLVDAEVDLTVVAPDGLPVSRSRAPFMDRGQTEYRRLRVRYGAPPGQYRIVLAGTNHTEYTLEARAASMEGELLSGNAGAAIGPGEVHTYEATIPTSPDDGGSLERIAVGGASSANLVALGLGAAGLATGAYAVVRARRSRRSERRE